MENGLHKMHSFNPIKVIVIEHLLSLSWHHVLVTKKEIEGYVFPYKLVPKLMTLSDFILFLLIFQIKK